MRLIDADALIEAHYDYCCKHHGEADVFYAWSLQLMKNAPTIDRPNVSDCWGCNCPKMERLFADRTQGCKGCKHWIYRRYFGEDCEFDNLENCKYEPKDERENNG